MPGQCQGSAQNSRFEGGVTGIRSACHMAAGGMQIRRRRVAGDAGLRPPAWTGQCAPAPREQTMRLPGDRAPNRRGHPLSRQPVTAPRNGVAARVPSSSAYHPSHAPRSPPLGNPNNGVLIGPWQHLQSGLTNTQRISFAFTPRRTERRSATLSRHKFLRTLMSRSPAAVFEIESG